mgnify:CR=1 FL=1
MRVLICLAVFAAALPGQPRTATLTGVVRLAGSGEPLHHATVSIVELRRSADTDAEGRYMFTELAPGVYHVLAHMHAMADETRAVQLEAGQEATIDFRLSLGVLRQQITVTASGREQAALETFQSVTSVNSLELSTRQATSLGEAVDGEPGVAKRSFGPGTARPVIRGFDGDRVLVLQDGLPTGTLSSQSGDHGEPLNPGAVDQVEIVKGPATLLYGSNAIGGVVNVISGHHQVHEHPHEGVRGYLTGNAGSANAYAGASGGVELGRGRWLASIDGGAGHAGDYSTPIGEVFNSHSSLQTGFGSLSRFGGRNAFSLSYGIQDGRHGVPFAEPDADEPVDLTFRRQQFRLHAGRAAFSRGIERADLYAGYTDWTHTELEGDHVCTRFFNKQFTARAVFEQHPAGRLAGRFGFYSVVRDYNAAGHESLSPPVNQLGLAVFALEEVNLERVKLQFGARYEHTGYSPTGAPARGFDGLSAAAGANAPLWSGGALAINYTRSYRAPALEELYNYGPHAGNLTFEIGNSSLKRELGNGIDAAVRHEGRRARGEVNLFYYRLDDFVYLAPTGHIEEGLVEAQYLQAGARYTGGEARASVLLLPEFWLNLGLDAVNAQLRAASVPLPRIPPVRGRVGIDFRRGGFAVRPELVLANAQRAVFPTETPTAGYALLNLAGSYTYASGHALHVFSCELNNAGNTLYRNHLSFIKNLAPEAGRGVRVTYTLRTF